MTKLRLAILISGRGSNMEALVKATQKTAFPAETVLVMSNRSDAAGLEYAATHGIENVAVPHREFAHDREAFERAMHTHLQRSNVDIIALAGFMRILTPWFVRQWDGKLINIHPSLLPKYPGLNTHQRALDAGDEQAGCSVHWVNEGVDTGEIIDQRRVSIVKDDTAETLAARVLQSEHDLYPKALEKACYSLLKC